MRNVTKLTLGSEVRIKSLSKPYMTLFVYIITLAKVAYHAKEFIIFLNSPHHY